ncbi:MAG: dihydroorotate dehydrogenase electron transfer subunit, partial [Lachnospiraceae bacterium]|nr:dihydroorotate dehydrogenase electron transfer subunit [Lachnospiraceae bacterium]
MSKTQIMAKITGLTKITDDIFSMWLKAGTIAKEAVPGQFVSLYCKNEDRLLPRPISICEINREEELLRLVFRVVGKGTEEFST